jgi:hypothetical protein
MDSCWELAHLLKVRKLGIGCSEIRAVPDHDPWEVKTMVI